MKKTIFTVWFFLVTLATADACTMGMKRDGIAPVQANRLKITTAYRNLSGSTMTEEVFNKVIDGVGSIYSPIVESHGGKLVIEKAWEDGTPNAYANRSTGSWIVHMYGGLARHDAMTPDGLALVVCHELGHHLGGYPKADAIWGSKWASNEGQSDYFGSTKCIRKYFKSLGDSAQVMSTQFVPEAVQSKCFATWGQSQDHSICVRASMAGLALANVLSRLSKMSTDPDFTKPDTNVVGSTNSAHPAAQCRLDTYFNGSLCGVSDTIDFGAKEETTGACVSYDQVGARPKCWFKPAPAVNANNKFRVASR